VSRVFSPTPRRIYTGFDDRYYTVCLWNEGASEHLVKGRKFAVGPGQGMVYAPSCETLSVPGNPVSMDAIVIRIPAESVRAEASLLLGPRETEEPFEITLLTRSAASGE